MASPLNRLKPPKLSCQSRKGSSLAKLSQALYKSNQNPSFIDKCSASASLLSYHPWRPLCCIEALTSTPLLDPGWRFRHPNALQSTPFENVFLSSSNVATVGETVGETVGWSFWHALGGGVKGEPERQGENISTKGTGQLKTFFRELPVKTWSLRGCKDDFIIGQTWCGSGDKWLLVLSDVSPEGFISDLFLFSEALLFSLWRSPPPGCELPSLPLVIAVFLRTLREKIRGLQLINHSLNCVKGFVLNLKTSLNLHSRNYLWLTQPLLCSCWTSSKIFWSQTEP